MKITPEQLEHIKNNVEAGLRAVGIEVEARRGLCTTKKN